MKPDGITINIEVEIPEETVQRCIQILNMYLTDKPYLTIKIYENMDQDQLKRFMLFVPKEKNDGQS